jgi:8-oxo-dGTP diphosphatase
MDDKTVAKVPHGKQCPHCGRFDNRGLSIDAVIIKGDKILLGKRGSEPFKGYWAIFGGFVEWDESVEEALAREIKEETNLTITKQTLIGIYSKPSRHPRQAVTVAYAVEVEGEPHAGDDIVEVKWWSLIALPEFGFDHLEILTDYLNTR